MYKFVDFGKRDRFSSSPMSIQTIYNGHNLDDELTDSTGSFRTLVVQGRGGLNREIRSKDISGMDGYLEYGFRYPPREIRVKYIIKDRTNEGFRRRLNQLNEILIESKAQLEFTDEDYYFTATATDGGDIDDTSNMAVAWITFNCADPFKYSKALIRQPITTSYRTLDILGSREPEWEFVTTISTSASAVSITHLGGREVIVEGPFSAGQTVAIDSATRRVYIDGVPATNKLYLQSEFFQLGLGKFTLKASHTGILYYRERRV